MFGRHKRHARSSSLLSACHSFSPFLITPWFLIHIPGRKSLKWRSCCHLSRRPVGFIHPFFTPQTCSPSWWNYESRFIGWLLRHILYYCNRCNVSVFLAQRGIFQAFSFSIPLLRMFTPDSTPTPCPLLLPLSSVSTPFSLPPSCHHGPTLFCLLEERAPQGQKRGGGMTEMSQTDDNTKDLQWNDAKWLHKTHVLSHCIHTYTCIHHSTVNLVNKKLMLEYKWGQIILLKAIAAKN